MSIRYILFSSFFLFLIYQEIFSQSLDSTSLPLLVISTKDTLPIVNEPKTAAKLSFIYKGSNQWNHPTDFGNVYSGNIGIEIRGSYSATFPQKPYGFETRNSLGDNLNVSLLNLPSENDWILLANYNDKSFLRNALPCYLFRKMGHYAPRILHCEVMVNDKYQGIYVLTEKIKIDKNRLDLAKLKITDNSGDELTGGYIFKTDYYDGYNSWLSKYTSKSKPDGKVYFIYHDPEPDELTSQQKTYLQGYVNAFESSLYGTGFTDKKTGYRAYSDIQSFADYFIISEVSRNVDGYKKSRFLYKNKESKGGLLHSGPVWDFDWAFKNFNECIFKATDGSGWVYKAEQSCNSWPLPPSWALRMMEDPYFVNYVKTKYTTYRKTFLSENHIFHYIDSVSAILQVPQKRHFAKWDILGKNVGAPEVDLIPTTFDGEITKLKNWIRIRLAWLDAYMPGEIINISMDEGDFTSGIRLFPNPVSDYLYCETMREMLKIEVFNIFGAKIKEIQAYRSFSEQIDVSGLSQGLYFVKVSMQNGDVITGKVLVKR